MSHGNNNNNDHGAIDNDDIASLVQQAMTDLENGKQQDKNSQLAESSSNEYGSGDTSALVQEVMANIELEENSNNNNNNNINITQTNSNRGFENGENSISNISKEIDSLQGQKQLGQGEHAQSHEDLHAQLEQQLNFHQTTSENSQPLEQRNKIVGANDYEQELQRQIMSALGEDTDKNTNAESGSHLQQHSEQLNESHDFEQDLQKQIFDALDKAGDWGTESQNKSTEQQQQQQPQQPIQHDQLSNHQAVQPPRDTNDVVFSGSQNDYELELQKEIMSAFQERDTDSQAKSEGPHQVSDETTKYDQELHNEILNALKSDMHAAQDQSSQPQPIDLQQPTEVGQLQQNRQDQATAERGINPYEDALAELVQNVVNAQPEAESLHQSDQQNTDADIDMNAILQNALAMAVENPNALLQSFNVGGNETFPTQQQQYDMTQLHQQLQSTSEKDVTAKEKKKKPKEKKPRAPRKTGGRKKKEIKPVIPLTTLPSTFPGSAAYNAQYQAMILQQQQQQQLQQQIQQQLQLQLQQNLSQLQTPQQQLQQQQSAIQALPIPVPQLQQQQQLSQSQSLPAVQKDFVDFQEHASQPKIVIRDDHQERAHALGQTGLSSELSSLPLKPAEQIPKPAPMSSIVDTVKKTPPLLLSKDRSMDLANNKEKKLSIAETLALSRSNMSNGKFSSKLLQNSTTFDRSLVSRHQDYPRDKTVTESSSPSTTASNLYTFQSNDISTQGDKSSNSIESALLLAKQMFAKKAEKSGAVNSVKDAEGEINKNARDLSQLAGDTVSSVNSQSNAVVRNITNMFPKLPGNIISAISTAINNVLTDGSATVTNRNRPHSAKKLIDIKHNKRRPAAVKDETEEEQLERIRQENRERKKRWRDANKLKNQNNDLRARLKKRAITLYGVENSPAKTEWIESEFEKRKNRRIIKSGKMEDLSLAINKIISELDINKVNPDSLNTIIYQSVNTILNSTNSSQSVNEIIRSISPSDVEDIPGLPKGSVSSFKISTPDGNLIKDGSETPASANETNTTIEEKSDKVAPPSKLPDMELSSLVAANNGIITEKSVKAPQSSSQKRTTELMAKLDLKKPKMSIPLIPLNRSMGSSAKTVIEIDPLLTSERPASTTSNPDAGEVGIADKPVESSINEGKSTLSSHASEQRPKNNAVTAPHTPTIHPSLQRPIKIPSFKKPESSKPLSAAKTVQLGATGAEQSIKNEEKLNDDEPEKQNDSSFKLKTETPRPINRVPGLRKPPAFQGLRKPGAFQRPIDREKKKNGIMSIRS